MFFHFSLYFHISTIVMIVVTVKKIFKEVKMSDFGCLKVIIHYAHLFPPLLKENVKHTQVK